jgi:hypothetical protein
MNQRLLYAQGLPTDGQKRCLRKLVGTSGLHGVFSWYNLKILAVVSFEKSLATVFSTLPSGASTITIEAAGCLQHEDYQMTSTRAHQTGSFLFKHRRVYFGYKWACCKTERLV